ncbi:hypothetical protein JO972_16320 [Verrucomicrobiaceae bacterium 5K15]|uniref:Uncharacterized protein n=1 Tax=Oceaniferula flava TaxID=2800421 RepID=A0AAE2SHM5_9BACT|nr:hypothetical protein [Oceaniferula flavus]MBK1856536.1 hypothetical protein [Oceaniferula flavus]MBM1137843.1 hypothetical protein [Oceaniferula flavus]
MLKYSTKTAPLKRAAIINAWQEFAAEESFAGMTLAEFEAATLPSVTVREEIGQGLVKIAGLRRQRDAHDSAMREQLSLVVNAVRGHPQYGEDCPLYKAIGYVPKSERASGLHRGDGGKPAGEPGDAAAGEAETNPDAA